MSSHKKGSRKPAQASGAAEKPQTTGPAKQLVFGRKPRLTTARGIHKEQRSLYADLLNGRIPQPVAATANQILLGMTATLELVMLEKQLAAIDKAAAAPQRPALTFDGASGDVIDTPLVIESEPERERRGLN